MKKIISFVLIVVLCLVLAACERTLPAEDMAAVCGTWYQCGEGDDANTPGYLHLNRDGTAVYNGEGGYTWTGRKDREESILFVTIEAEEEKHSFDVYAGDPNSLTGRLTMEKDGPSWDYLKVNRACETSWFYELFTQWYPREGDAVAQDVELKSDGTAQIDGQRFFWTVSAADDGAEKIVCLTLFDEQGTAATLDVNRQDNDLCNLSIYDHNQSKVSEYYAHPLLCSVDDGSWESFDRYTMIEDGFSLNPWSDTVTIDNKEYAVRYDLKASQEGLRVNIQEGETIRYVADIFMDGDYPAATLTDQQSGQQTLYFNNNYGYDPANPDAAYYQTVNLIYQYASDSGIYNPETNEYMDKEECLPYIYAKLTELGDYRQAQEFLSRFTVVSDKLIEQTLLTTDRLNNVSSTWVNQYGYDENGVMIWARGEDIPEMYGVFETYEPQYFAYDNKGRIAEVKVFHGNTAEAVGTPIFDTVYKVVGMGVREAEKEYTSVFTYGAGARVIRLEIPNADYGCSRMYEYTYDDAGKLITKVLTLWEGRKVTTSHYTYSGDALAEIQQTRYDWGDEYHWTYTFANDDRGRPLSAVITTDDPDVMYKAQEYKYIYKDLYFFDSTGLVLGD